MAAPPADGVECCKPNHFSMARPDGAARPNHPRGDNQDPALITASQRRAAALPGTGGRARDGASCCRRLDQPP